MNWILVIVLYIAFSLLWILGKYILFLALIASWKDGFKSKECVFFLYEKRLIFKSFFSESSCNNSIKNRNIILGIWFDSENFDDFFYQFSAWIYEKDYYHQATRHARFIKRIKGYRE